jgi:hypothetical protein
MVARLGTALLLVDVLLVVATAFVALGHRFPIEAIGVQLDLRAECNVATWWSSVLLLGAGSLAAANGLGQAGIERATWLAAAALFVALSCDEVAQLHEWIGARFYAYAGGDNPLSHAVGLSGEGAGRWLVPLSPLFLAAVLFLVWLVRRCLRGSTRARWLAGCATACWILTLGAEYATGLLQRAGMPRALAPPFEEANEIIGTTLFILAFASALRHRPPPASATNRAR